MSEQRPDVRSGYDLWSDSYDETPNPVVQLDERVTPAVIAARRGEHILDAGCGTGRYFDALAQDGAEVVGLDFSAGMLRVAHGKHPGIALVQADLSRPWPFRDRCFDAVLCALVGEHLADLRPVSAEMHRLLRPGGRAVFSVYHPAMAAAGKEANFHRDGVEYRLGAFQHTPDDYVAAFRAAGFRGVHTREFNGDVALAAAVPAARKYVGFPMLLVIAPDPLSLSQAQ